MSSTNDSPTGLSAKVTTGVEGLDRILEGGLPRNQVYLIQGRPGSGKTTLGLQFLLKGVQAGERGLYITLSQTGQELRRIAHSHGWSLEGVEVHELSATETAESLAAQQTLFHSADVELNETTAAFREVVERIDPDRVVFDSIADVRLLAGDLLRYRRQVLSLKQFFAGRACTVLLLDDESAEGGDTDLQGLVHGLIHLEQTSPDRENVRRRLQVVKMRGMAYHDGIHDFRILTGGLAVYPRLKTAGADEHKEWGVLKSGIDALDTLLGGGLEQGTVCVIAGPSGTGKTSLTLPYVLNAAEQGIGSAIFLFDERLETFCRQAENLNMDVHPYEQDGTLSVRKISTGECSPGEFAQLVRQAVEEQGAGVVVIDSMTGYENAMLQERLLITQMHELLTYLSQRGVLTLITAAHKGLVGGGIEGETRISYLADSVLLLRHFEAEGTIRKAVSVVKKRHSNFEKTIRELRMSSDGIELGEPITEFSDVLTNIPKFKGSQQRLMEETDDET